MSAESENQGPRQLALDWVDAFIVVAVGVGWSIVLHVMGLRSTFAVGAVAAVVLAAIVGRRKFFGAPIRGVRHTASFLGTLAAMLIVFGMLAGALGVFLLLRDTTLPPPDLDKLEEQNPFGDPEIEERRRDEDVKQRRVELAIAAGGLLLIACGGKLDEWWTKKRG